MIGKATVQDLQPSRTARALDLSSATIQDTERRLDLIERGAVFDRTWCLVDVGMRLAWLSAKGAPVEQINPLVFRFREVERKL